MKSVLITGAGGFLGGAVGRRFAAEHWSVVGLGATVDSTMRWNAFHRMMLPDVRFADVLESVRPDVLMHCAGRASVPESFADPRGDFDSSPLVLFEVLEQIRRSSPHTRVIFLSSAAVYGNPRSLPIDETHACAPVSPYGFHKRMCEELCEEFTRCFGVATASARIFSAYGSGLHRQVVWDICEKALRDREVLLQGTGEESRDFIHVDDAAAALFLLATQGECVGGAYNVASGIETRIADLAAEVVSNVAPGKKVRFSGSIPQGMPQRWRADITRLRAIGFQPARAFRAGLGETLAHHQREIAGRCLKKSA